MGRKEKATHPPFVPPIKGGIVLFELSRRQPNLFGTTEFSVVEALVKILYSL